MRDQTVLRSAAQAECDKKFDRSAIPERTYNGNFDVNAQIGDIG